MSDKTEVNVEGGAGCLFFFGIIITACCVGTLSETVYGWLTVGILFVFWGLATAERRR